MSFIDREIDPERQIQVVTAYELLTILYDTKSGMRIFPTTWVLVITIDSWILHSVPKRICGEKIVAL